MPWTSHAIAQMILLVIQLEEGEIDEGSTTRFGTWVYIYVGPSIVWYCCLDALWNHLDSLDVGKKMVCNQSTAIKPSTTGPMPAPAFAT
jgi:hypothetical protein